MTETQKEPSEQKRTGGAVLPKMFHIGIPIASALIILAFALTLALPANQSTLPAESTVFFIPIYITIVIILVFSCMYIFKEFVEKDPDAATAWNEKD